MDSGITLKNKLFESVSMEKIGENGYYINYKHNNQSFKVKFFVENGELDEYILITSPDFADGDYIDLFNIYNGKIYEGHEISQVAEIIINFAIKNMGKQDTNSLLDSVIKLINNVYEE
jgi:hypothetical protein